MGKERAGELGICGHSSPLMEHARRSLTARQSVFFDQIRVEQALQESGYIACFVNSPAMTRTTGTKCSDLGDHIPPRSYALFQARSAVRDLLEQLKAEGRGGL